MKLTNKILLVFLILLVLLVTTYKIIFNGKVELIPNAIDKNADYIYRKISFAEKPINTLELNGRFIVNLIKSDTLFVVIHGPDNLVNNYMGLEQNGSRMSISSKIDLSKYYHPITIDFRTNKLDAVFLSGGTIVSTKKFDGDLLNVTLKDSAMFDATSSMFNKVNIIGENKSTTMISKTKNATVQLLDESNLLLTLDGGEISGTIGAKTDFGLEGDIKKNSVIRVKERKNGREK